MIVVSNTSPIVNLAAIRHLHLLPQLFGAITIPEAVFHEIAVKGSGRPGAEEVRSADWVSVRAVADRRLAHAFERTLHAGEAEALALALEIDATWTLLDEQAARETAASLGLRYTGLLGVLARAKEKSLIPAVRPLLDALRQEAGFWISPPLYGHILWRAGEDV